MAPYTLHNADGSPRAGDPVLDHNMKNLCDELGGYITDGTGATVYPEEG